MNATRVANAQLRFKNIVGRLREILELTDKLANGVPAQMPFAQSMVRPQLQVRPPACTVSRIPTRMIYSQGFHEYLAGVICAGGFAKI